MPEIITDEVNRVFKVDGIIYPSATEILQEMGFIDTTWFTEQGADNGTRRHKVLQLAALDDLIESSVDIEDMPFLLAFQNLMETTKAVPIKECIEERRFNSIYGYCGKPDLPVIYNGRNEIWDFKTGIKQGWHGLQIGGYLGLFDDIFYGRCIYLQPNGKFKLSTNIYGRAERTDFLTILSAHYLKEKYK